MAEQPGPSITADEALTRLKEGNERFVRGQARFPTVQKDILAGLAAGQRPYATIIGCSDSRVPPELIFDAGFGELFIIRVAGNVMMSAVTGTIQYAALYLGTPLFMVLGHEGCGAVDAALAVIHHDAWMPPHIAALLDHIVPGLELPEGLSAEEERAAAIEANVRWSMRQILETPDGKARAEDGWMKLVGGIYELGTGRVRVLA
jgi:carbonic anhydrase